MMMINRVGISQQDNQTLGSQGDADQHIEHIPENAMSSVCVQCSAV